VRAAELGSRWRGDIGKKVWNWGCLPLNSYLLLFCLTSVIEGDNSGIFRHTAVDSKATSLYPAMEGDLANKNGIIW